MLEIELIHLQPFTESHFHFLIAVQSASSKVLFQSPKQMVCCTLPYSKCCLINTELTDCETSLTEHASYSQGLYMPLDASHSSQCYMLYIILFNISTGKIILHCSETNEV